MQPSSTSRFKASLEPCRSAPGGKDWGHRFPTGVKVYTLEFGQQEPHVPTICRGGRTLSVQQASKFHGNKIFCVYVGSIAFTKSWEAQRESTVS